MKKLTTKNRMKKDAQAAPAVQSSQFMAGPQKATGRDCTDGSCPFEETPVNNQNPFEETGPALSTSGGTPGVVKNTDPIESGESTKAKASLAPLPGSKPMIQPVQPVQTAVPVAVPQRKNPYEVPF